MKAKAVWSSRFVTLSILGIAPSLLGLLTFLFYYPSLSYPFQFDDISNILKNFNIRFFDPSRYFFRVRWLGDLLNSLNYKLGGFEPFWYRTTNVIIHCLSGVLLFYLIYLLASKATQHKFLKKNGAIIAFLSSALFLLHPVQTQTVSYVIQARLEGVAVLFILLTLLLFCASSWTTSFGVKLLCRALLLIASFFTCGTKEIAIVTPLLAMLIDWFFIAEQDIKKFKANWLNNGLVWLGIVGTFIYFQSIKWFSSLIGMTVGNNRGNLLTDEKITNITAYHYFISEFKVIIHYFLIFLAPFFLSVEYDWKLSPTFFCSESFIPFLIIVTTLIVIAYAMWNRKCSIFSFGLLWFLISIAPRSTIIPSAELVCDYKTYLASIGVFFIMSYGLIALIETGYQWFTRTTAHLLLTTFLAVESSLFTYITALTYHSSLPLFYLFFFSTLLCLALFVYALYQQNSSRSFFTWPLLFLLTTPLGYSALTRNLVWESCESFWRDVVEKAPTKARGHNNLGVALVNIGKHDEAVEEYRKAIALDRFYCDPWSNLAVVYSHRNETEKGIAALQNALRIYPAHAEAYNNLGTFYKAKKDLESAEYCFNQALKYRPHYGKAYLNLATIYLQKNDNESAWMYAQKATQADLDNYDGFNELGKMGMLIGKYKEAAHAFEVALKKRPHGNIRAEDYAKIGDAYLYAHEFRSALHYYTLLQQRYPQEPKYHYALGETYFELNEIEKALTSFSCYVQSKDSQFPFAPLRVAQCLEKLNRFNEAYICLNSILQSNLDDSVKTVAQNQLKRYNA